MEYFDYYRERFRRQKRPIFFSRIEWVYYLRTTLYAPPDLGHPMFTETLKALPNTIFITVNPKPEIKLETFTRALARSVTKTAVDAYTYSIEQRGKSEETLGEGTHAHILIEYHGRSYGQLKNDFIRTFKKLIGNDKHVHCKQVFNKTNVINYITKNKDLDILFRQKYNLSPIYTNAIRETEIPS